MQNLNTREKFARTGQGKASLEERGQQKRTTTMANRNEQRTRREKKRNYYDRQ